MYKNYKSNKSSNVLLDLAGLEALGLTGAGAETGTGLAEELKSMVERSISSMRSTGSLAAAGALEPKKSTSNKSSLAL